MSIQNLIDRTFWSGYASSSLGIGDVFICFITVIMLSTYIFFAYKNFTKKTFYNQSFNISLVVLAVIIASIILTIQSNIVISLGMVGALSIVRYRTAIKDPMDLVFLFWSISVGIICGAGFALIAIISSVVITVGVDLFSKIHQSSTAMILLVNSSDYHAEEEIMETIKKYCKVYQVKSRNLTKDYLDMAIEVLPENQEGGLLVQSLIALPNVSSASLISHDGEVTL